MIKSYWIRLLLFAVVGAAIGLGLSLASPPKYEAVLQLMIDQPLGAGMPAGTEAANMMADLNNAGRGRSVSTQVEQLTSWGVIREAAENTKTGLRIEPNDEELNPQTLQQAIIVSADATSDMITMKVRMSSPERAQRVAQEMYNAFERKNSKTSRELGTQIIGSLNTLKKTLKVQLDESERQLEQVRLGGIGPDAQTMEQQTVMNVYRLQDQVAGLEIEYAAAAERVRGLEKELAKQPKMTLESRSIQTNPNLAGMESALAGARAERDSLLERYLEDHEIVRATDVKIAKLESELTKMKQEYPAGRGYTVNPLYRTFSGALSEAKVAYASLKDRLTAARSELASREAHQATIPPLQTKFQKIAREMSVLERRYADTSSALEGFSGIQRAREAPTSVVSAPEAFPDPVSPRHPINFMFGLVGGLIIGVLSMLSTEGKRQPIRSLAQLNSLAIQPVYRIIPELRMPFRGLNKAPAEPFETLLVNFRRSDKRPYRMGIVGITKDSGASITALNAALAAEKHGNRAVIVETDPRSTIKRLLSRQGMAVEGLLTKISPGVTLYSTDALRQVAGPDGTTTFGNDISTLEGDLTVFDFEPSTESAEYAFAAPHLDEIVVLVRAEKTKSVEFLHAQQALMESGCPIVTVVFTRSSDQQLVTESVSYEQPKALAQ